MAEYTYIAYGLTIRTPFACPILPLAPEGAIPDIHVAFGDVPERLPGAVAANAAWEVVEGRFLLRGGNRAGIFLAEQGNRVTIKPSPTAEEHMLAFLLLSSVLAVLLQQRGLLVLHGNAAITPHGVVVISGTSGVGKSTTLVALLDRGCEMLSDDITALTQNGQGQVIALPGIPQLHLTEDAAAGLGQDISNLPRYPWKRMKAPVPTAEIMASEPAPLHAIYRLDSHTGDGIALRQLSGAAKFLALQRCVYGPVLPTEHPGLFALFSAVIETTHIYHLSRPANAWTVNEIADLMLSS